MYVHVRARNLLKQFHTLAKYISHFEFFRTLLGHKNKTKHFLHHLRSTSF